MGKIHLKSKFGFTLVEVMIAIAIIGTLASITTFALGRGRDKGNDARRKADLKAIQTAAVAYYQDHSQFPPDPASSPGNVYSSDVGGTNWIPGISSYINKLPKDPLQAGILYFLANLIKAPVQGGERFLAGLFSSPNRSAATPQVAGTTTVTINATTNDGWLQYSSTTYPPGGGGGGVCGSTAASSQLSIGQFSISGTYYKRRAYLSFDTSTIPAGSTINSVTLTQLLSSKANALTSFNLLALNYNWTPPLACTQWGGSPPTATQVGSISTLNLPANGSMFNMTLANSAINIGGATNIMLISDRDFANTAPFQNEYLYLGSAEVAAPNNTQISITYTPPVAPTPTPTPTPTAVPGGSLVGYWKLDEPSGSTLTSDSSGNGNNGTTSAFWSPNFTAGKYNNGLNFDGVSGHYVNVPGTASLNVTGPFTISAWVNPGPIAFNAQPIMIKEDASGNTIALDITNNGKANFGIKNGASNLSTATNTALSPGTWYYLTGIYDGTNISIYLNGVLQSSIASGPAASMLTPPLQFGDSSVDAWWGQYIGVLDEVRMYNYAITTAQMLTDMNNGVPVSPPTVVTNAATGIGSSGATLNGTANPNGFASTGWFRYSNTNPGTCNDTFGTRAPATGGNNLGSGTANVAFSQTIGSLLPTKTYYFCALASNSIGTTPSSTVLSFVTTAVPPATPTPYPGPVADIKANGSNGPISANSGDSISISWTSFNASTCNVAGGPGGSGTSGSFSWTADVSTTFTLSCTGPSGPASDSVLVNVAAVGVATCQGKKNIYCYIVNTDRSSFVLWAQLNDTTDPQIATNPGALCTLSPPDPNFNYCIQSSSL